MNGLSVELIGYLASALVAISMLMVSIVRLRVINLVGSMAFCVYGFFLPSIPLILTNAFIIVVNLVQLRRVWLQGRQSCDYILATDSRMVQLADYVRANQRDIARHAPYFSIEFMRLALDNGGQAFLAFHEAQIRGLAVWMPLTGLRASDYPTYDGLQELIDQLIKANKAGKGAFLLIDYIDLRYRDLGLGQKLSQVLARISSAEIRQLYTLCPASLGRSKSYLRSQGFVPDGRAGNLVLWQRPLPPALPREC